MSFESAMQRLGELRTMIDPVNPGPVTPAAQTGAAGGAGSANFAALLAQAQSQQQLISSANGEEGSDSSSSLTSMLSGGGAAGMGSFAGLANSSTASGLPLLQPSQSALMQQYMLQGASPGYPMYPTWGPPPMGGDAGQRIVQLATQELERGVQETSWNNSDRIAEYRTATKGAANTPGPWCAYFVSWLCNQSGTPIGPDGSGFGYVPSMEAWGKQTGKWFDAGSRPPQPGDIVIFDWGQDGLSDHTGVVERVDMDGTVHTIEGNSSDRIARRSYPDEGKIAGYIRPA